MGKRLRSGSARGHDVAVRHPLARPARGQLTLPSAPATTAASASPSAHQPAGHRGLLRPSGEPPPRPRPTGLRPAARPGRLPPSVPTRRCPDDRCGGAGSTPARRGRVGQPHRGRPSSPPPRRVSAPPPPDGVLPTQQRSPQQPGVGLPARGGHPVSRHRSARIAHPLLVLDEDAQLAVELVTPTLSRGEPAAQPHPTGPTRRDPCRRASWSPPASEGARPAARATAW